MKLTTVQIQEIDNALRKIGIQYYDVRLELTDHVATLLEAQQGSFDDNLVAYIKENKKALRRLNFRFMRVGARKGLKLLFASFFSWPVALVFVAIVGVGKLIQQFAAPDDMGIFMFLIFCIFSCTSSFPSVLGAIRKRENYSFTGGIGFLPAILFFPSITMMNNIPDVNYLILYYSLISAFSVNIYFTIKKLYRQYRSIYQVV